jgi:ABC-type sulfate transport system substrate-binding protein
MSNGMNDYDVDNLVLHLVLVCCCNKISEVYFITKRSLFSSIWEAESPKSSSPFCLARAFWSHHSKADGIT